MVEIIETPAFTDEYTGSSATPTGFLMGGVGDKITAVVTANVHWESVEIYAAFDSVAKTITRKDNISWRNVGFNQGDTFVVIGETPTPNDGSYTIVSITSVVNPYDTITVVESISTTGSYGDVTFRGTTPINVIDFYFNLIENKQAPSLQSIVDRGASQLKRAFEWPWNVNDVINLSVVTSSIGWDTAPAGVPGTVKKISNATSYNNYVQQFVITHTFEITPEFISGHQLLLTQTLQGNYSPPKYFIDINCLKYICDIQAYFTPNNPNFVHGTKNNEFLAGNTGWFNEFLNGGVPEYSLKSVTYGYALTPAVSTTFQVTTKNTGSANVSFNFNQGCEAFNIIGIPAQANTGALAAYIANAIYSASSGRFIGAVNGSFFTLTSLQIQGTAANALTMTVSIVATGSISPGSGAFTGGTDGVLSKLDFSQDVLVTAQIYSVNGHFTPSPNGNKMAVNFAYCPLNETQYVNTKTNYQQNFKRDRAFITLGGCPVNGEQYGTDYQSMKAVSAVIVDANNATVMFRIALSSAMATFIIRLGSTNRNYLLWVTPQQRSITTPIAQDRNPVIIDFQNGDYNTDDATQLIWNDILFYQYPDTTTNGYTDYKGFIQDNVLSKILFKVKNGSLLNNVSVKIVAVPSGQGTAFNLETNSFDFTGQYGCANDIQQPITIQRNGNFAACDPYGQITFDRNTGLDDPNYFGYEIDYGFMLRYEEWYKLRNFDKCFINNPSENWSNYSLRPGWGIQLQVTASVTDANGVTTLLQRTANLSVNANAQASDGHGGAITYSLDTLVSTISGDVSVGGVIVADPEEVTHVLITCKGDFSSFPTGYNGYYGWLALDLEYVGGETFIDKTTTEAANLSTSKWLNQCVLTKVDNNTITLTADIDNSQIDSTVLRYLITGRLGFKKT